MAFALALQSVHDLPNNHGEIIFTATTAIVVLTVSFISPISCSGWTFWERHLCVDCLHRHGFSCKLLGVWTNRYVCNEVNPKVDQWNLTTITWFWTLWAHSGSCDRWLYFNYAREIGGGGWSEWGQHNAWCEPMSVFFLDLNSAFVTIELED